MKTAILSVFLLIAICGNAMAQQPQPAQPKLIPIVFETLETQDQLLNALLACPNSVVMFGLPETVPVWKPVNDKVLEVQAYLATQKADSRLDFFYIESGDTPEEATAFLSLVMKFTGQTDENRVGLPAMAIVQGAKPNQLVEEAIKRTFVGVEQCKDPFLQTIGVRAQPQQTEASVPGLPEVKVINQENELWKVVRSGAPSYLVFCRLYKSACINAKITFEMMRNRPNNVPIYIVDLRRPDGHTRDFRHEFLIEKEFIPTAEEGRIVNNPVVGVLVAGYTPNNDHLKDLVKFRLVGGEVVSKLVDAITAFEGPPQGEGTIELVPLVPLVPSE